MVRRTTGTGHPATDNLAGTDVYGTAHADMKGDTFSLDFSNMPYTEIIFVTGDCQQWVKMSKTEIDLGPWGSSLSSRTVLGSNYNNAEHQIMMLWDETKSKNPIITNLDNSGQGQSY